MYFCKKSLDLIDLFSPPFWISLVDIYTMCSNRLVYMKFLFSGVFIFIFISMPPARVESG